MDAEILALGGSLTFGINAAANLLEIRIQVKKSY